jgi:hypothetical protein
MKRRLASAFVVVALLAGTSTGQSKEVHDLSVYAGKYPWDQVESVEFLENPAVKLAVTKATTDLAVREAILSGTRNSVSIPMVAVGKYLYLHAFEPASGGDTSWSLLISTDASDAAVCFSTLAGDSGIGRTALAVRSSWYADGKIFLSRKFSCPGRDEIEDEARYRILPALATARGQLQYESCFGILNTGASMAGSSLVGDGACFISAESAAEDLVTRGCGEGDACLVEAMVEVSKDDGRKEIREVLSVNRVATEPEALGTYLDQIAGFMDGLYVDRKIGCDALNPTAGKLVSIHLSRKAGPAIQLGERYCVVLRASGDAPNPAGFNSVLDLRCGNAPEEDEALRSGDAGATKTIRLSASNSREISLDDETSLLRCPIRTSYVPTWWMTEPPSNVLLLDY